MASGRLIDYLGAGTLASRPAAPDAYTGTLALYWATDVNVVYGWDGANWQVLATGESIPAVEPSGGWADGAMLQYDAGAGAFVEIPPGVPGQVMTQQSGQVADWDDPTGGVTSVNGQTGDVSLSLEDLDDVMTGTGVPEAGDVLTWSGSEWTANPPAAGGVTSVNGQTGAVVLSLEDLDDVLVNTGAPDTGDVLTWDGAAWTASPPSSSSASGQLVEGRLTLQSGTPVPTSDLTAQTTIYFTPYLGNKITLWDGAAWIDTEFTEISLALGTLTTASNYDVYAYLNAGVVALDAPVAWRAGGQAITGATNATPIVITANSHGLQNGDVVYISEVGGNTAANGTWVVANVAANTYELTGSVGNGAYTASTGWHNARVGATVPSIQDGRYCQTGDKTRLYLGTFRTTSTTTTEDSMGGSASQTGGKRFLWNYYNRVTRQLAVFDSTSTWAYTTATWRAANAISANRVEMVIGLDEEAMSASCVATVGLQNNSSGTSAKITLALDTTAVPWNGLAAGAYVNGTTVNRIPLTAAFARTVRPGYHWLQWLEMGTDTTCTFSGSFSAVQSGVVATMRC
jgi:hypothetical protein